MYTKRNVGWGLIFRYAWKKVIFYTFYSGAIFCVYHFLGWDFIDIPFQPLSVIGIAVAFYIGFKNSQSYDRFWEGRKIWGGIVNYSRTWSIQVLSFVTSDDSAFNKKSIKNSFIAILHGLILYGFNYANLNLGRLKKIVVSKSCSINMVNETLLVVKRSSL